jgi:predicted HicB family RNase H-like nuclease
MERIMKNTTKTSDDVVREYLARPYSRILIPQEGGGFSAEILEFPGCFAEGDSAQDAYASLEEAASGWLLACLANETPVPPPLTNYEASGSGKFALRLPRSLHLRASKAAAKESVSLNQYIVTAVSEKLGGALVIDQLAQVLSEVRGLHRAVRVSAFQQFAETTGKAEYRVWGFKIDHSAQSADTTRYN